MTRRTTQVLGWTVGGLVAVVLLIAGLIWLRIDAYAKDAFEASATNSFGLPTTTDRVTVSLLSGDVGVKRFQVANVQGYSPDQLMAVQKIDVGVELASLWGETLRVPQVVMDEFTLYITQKGLKTNVAEMLAKMRQRSEQAPAEPGRKLLIDRVLVRNVVAQVHLTMPGQEPRTMQVNVPELVLEDVTPENANSVAMEEVMRRVFPAVVAAVLEQGHGVLPADLLSSIGGELNETVAALGRDVQRMVSQAGGDTLGRVIHALPAELQEPLKGAGEKLKLDNFINRDK